MSEEDVKFIRHKPTFPDTVENLRGEVTTWKDAFNKYARHLMDCDKVKPLSFRLNRQCTCGLSTYLDLLGKD